VAQPLGAATWDVRQEQLLLLLLLLPEQQPLPTRCRSLVWQRRSSTWGW
jgi:hypothetical protein